MSTEAELQAALVLAQQECATWKEMAIARAGERNAVRDTLADVQVKFRAAEAAYIDMKARAQRIRLATINEAACVPRQFYDDIEQYSCEHGCEDNYLAIEKRIYALKNVEQLELVTEKGHA